MPIKFSTLFTVLLLAFSLLTSARAQSDTAANDPALTDLRSLVDQIRQKAQGERDPAAFAPEIARFDELLAKYPGKSEATATIAMMKALLYVQVLNDETKARELMLAVKKDYPETEPAKAVDQIIAQLDKAGEMKKAQGELVGKTAPELHFQWSSQEGLKTLSSLKGRVVVIDFWATWCGPCLASFPQIRTHVAHFKGTPVTFLGVTSIQGFVANLGERIDTEGDPAKEISLMPQFMKAKDMTWDVAVSDEPVFNPAYGIEGIPFLAIIAPDGTVRYAGLHPGDPAADVAGKIEGLLKEFKLPLPKS